MKTLTTTAALAAVLFSTQVLANDVDPFGFEKEHFITSKTRAEVVADLKVAQATGQMPVPGEIGVRPIDTPSVKSRTQVAAETLEAKRLGLIAYGEQAPTQATPEQERLIEMAGLRAVQNVAATRRGDRTGG